MEKFWKLIEDNMLLTLAILLIIIAINTLCSIYLVNKWYDAKSQASAKECPSVVCPVCPECAACPSIEDTDSSKECTTVQAVETVRQPVFKPVHFDYNAYDLKHYFVDKVQVVAEYLKTNTDKGVILYGNTDDKGQISYNRRLAERRAENVKKYLVKHGIDSTRIKIQIYGEHKSVQSNETQEGRLKIRRVDFEIKDYPWKE